ncbi:hypothetical protein BDF14DRAFT_876438 [Spinellus fusiger]|nr:hypothetical protein BDF14DRAFT_876438 [Spinellus fusiger]
MSFLFSFSCGSYYRDAHCMRLSNIHNGHAIELVERLVAVTSVPVKNSATNTQVTQTLEPAPLEPKIVSVHNTAEKKEKSVVDKTGNEKAVTSQQPTVIETVTETVEAPQDMDEEWVKGFEDKVRFSSIRYSGKARSSSVHQSTLQSKETLVEKTPAKETPVEKTPVEKTPVEKTPAKETPVETASWAPADNPLEQQQQDRLREMLLQVQQEQAQAIAQTHAHLTDKKPQSPSVSEAATKAVSQQASSTSKRHFYIHSLIGTSVALWLFYGEEGI